MKFIVFAAAMLVALIGPATAQTGLDGHWHAQLKMPDGGVIEISTVITGNTYITNSQSMVQTNMGIFPYMSSQSGEVMFTPPDNLRLVVLDWNPKSTPGFPVYPPPNGNYTIISATAQQLTLIDNICTMNASVAQCTFTFQKVN